MTKLIPKSDPQYFTETSSEPYDRHHYKLVYDNKEIIVKTWEEVKERWWNNCHLPTFDAVVHVIDKPKTKKKSKGF